MNKIMKRTGSVNSRDPLVCFLYLLGRDKIPLGDIEEIMTHMSEKTTLYCNGHLAKYAKDVAKRLRKHF